MIDNFPKVGDTVFYVALVNGRYHILEDVYEYEDPAMLASFKQLPIARTYEELIRTKKVLNNSLKTIKEKINSIKDVSFGKVHRTSYKQGYIVYNVDLILKKE